MSVRPLTLAFLLIAALFSAAPARAALVDASGELKDNGTTGWKIEFDPAKVQQPDFTGTPNDERSLDGRLFVDLIRFEPGTPFIDIKFIQIRETPGDLNFGLRITVAFQIDNATKTNWNGFELELLEGGTDFDAGDDQRDHPGNAHFHNLGADGAIAFEPFTLLSPRNPSATNLGKIWRLGKGVFPKDTFSFWGGIGIHQWERRVANQTESRNFALRLTPIATPEPATLATLAGVGLCALVRRKRRTGTENPSVAAPRAP